jgi:uncharacterized membrane protein YhaH (DUF805 family)
MDWVYLFNNFDGRISRKTFWIALIIVMIADLTGHFVAEAIQGDRLSAIVDLALIYPYFAVTVKRAHDRDLPVWMLIAFFAAGAFLDLLTVLQWAGTDEQPSMLSLFVALPFTVFGLALLVELGFRRGTAGPNQYGPDPLAKS